MAYEKKEKLRLAIILGTSLLNGRGYEQFVMDFSRNINRDDVELKVLQTDIVNLRQTTLEEINEKVGNERILTVIGRSSRFRTSIFARIRKLPLGKVLEVSLVAPIIITILRKTIYKEALNEIREFDVIYLVDNEDYHLFKGFHSVIIGSAIGMFENPYSYYTRLITALIQSGLVYRKMSGIHLFPAHLGNVAEKLKSKNLLIQSLGVDSEIFSPDLKLTDNRLKFLFVGQLEYWKGSLDAAKAFLKISDYLDSELHIVGSGILFETIKKLNCDKIILHGSMDRVLLSRLYKECDVFIYPSHGETYGLVILEALSSGLYGLIGKNLRGNFDDFAKKGYIEYLEYDIDYISNKMAECHKNLGEIRSNKEKVHAYISQNYDWKVVSGRMLDFFRSNSSKAGNAELI